MHIAVDARELVGAPTGAGRYLAQLLRHWDRLPAAQMHRFTLYAHRAIRPPFERVDTSTRVLHGAGGTWWEQVTLAAALRRDRPDVLFAPAYTAPVLTMTPLAVAVHDVSFSAHPEWFLPREGLRRRVLTRRAASRARVVLTLSAFSRDEIVRLLGVRRDRVRVIPLGLGLVEDEEGAPATTAIPAGMVLFVGSVFNRRHVPTLIRAMPQVLARHPEVRLVIVGENRTYPHQDLAAIAVAAGVGSKVAIESYVDDESVRARYQQASVFVFLSEYEGFGLPPLEALAAGVPIVVLDTPVAREVYGPAAWYVSRPDPDEVARAILALLHVTTERKALLRAAPPVLARYRWADAAARTLQAVEGAGKG